GQTTSNCATTSSGAAAECWAAGNTVASPNCLLRSACRANGVVSCVEHVAHRAREHFRGKRLLQKGGAGDTMLQHLVVGVSGDVEDLHLRARKAELLCKGASADLRQDNISDEQRYRSLVRLADLKRFPARLRLQHAVSAAAQDLADKRADRVLVFNQQNGFVTTRGEFGRDWRSMRVGRALDRREVHIKTSS